MKNRLTIAVILSLILCILVIVPAFADSEVPEGYPPIRIDPDTGEAYDFGGRTVYIYDWWSNDDAEHSGREAEPDEDTQKLYAYRDWLEATYNVKIVETSLSDWSGNPAELAEINRNGGLNGTGSEGEWCVVAIASDYAASALSNELYMRWTIDMTDDKWNQADSQMMSVGGEVYGVHAGKTEPRNCVYFNKTVLEAAGIDWNDIYDAQQNGTWTWEMMESIMAQVQSSTDYYGMVGSGDDLAIGLMCSNNAAFFDYDENGQLVIAADRPEALAALTEWKEWNAAYKAPEPEDASWDWYKACWYQGNAAFYPAQAWQGFNDNSEMAGMEDEWGCVMYPMGPDADTYLGIANDNIYGVPNVYDAETAEKIQVIFDLYTNATPGVEENNDWVGNKLSYTDERAVNETYAMMRENEHSVPNTTILLGSNNDVLGPTLLWGQLSSMTAEEAVAQAAPTWERMINTFYNRTSSEVSLFLAEYNEDFVQVGDEGNVTVKLNQWVHFAASAPDAESISFHALTEPLTENSVVNDNNSFGGDFADWNDPDRRVDCQWIEVGYSENITRYIIAKAHYSDNSTAISNVIELHAVRDGEIEGNVEFSMPQDGDMNTLVNGRYQVPRDGRLFVDVHNMEGIDFFGLYIPGADESDRWIADSHWVKMSDGDKTRVPLTVPRCTVGEDYEVRVFAIKFGAPQKDAEVTIPIHVTEAGSDCPVILSMKDTFETGEPLRVFAHYTDPENIENGALMIRIHEKDNWDNEVFNQMQGYEDFWNDGECIWSSGTYVVDAYIFQYGEQVRAYENIKEITVTSAGRTAAPQVYKFMAMPEGQNLVLSVSAETSGDEVMPDWFDYALFRLDWGFAFIDAGSAESDENGNNTVTIDQGCFEAGGQYLIRLFGMKRGFDAGVTEFVFAVTSANAAENLVLTLNGSDNNEQEFPSSSNIHVKVAYPGLERPTAIRIMNGDHMEHWFGEEDNFERDWGFGDNEYIMFAEATWDEFDINAPGFDLNRDVNWTSRSNAIRLNIVSPNGEMREPQFTIDNPEMAPGASGVIPWGDDIVITIADEGPTDSEGRIVEDGWLFVNIDVERTNESGDSWWERVNHDWGYDIHSGINRIPTYNMEGGCRFRLEVGADAEGYSGRSFWTEFELGRRPDTGETIRYFTVNGNAQDFTVDTYTELRLLAYQSNAEWYNTVITETGNDDWRDDRGENRGGMLMDSWRPDHEGEYTLTAYAYGHLPEGQTDEEGNDFWEDEIGSVTVTATAPNGNLEAVTANMNDRAYVGETLEITFDEVPNAEEYSYWIHEDRDGRWISGESRRGPGTLTIDTSRLEPGVYWVEMDAMATGYNQSHGTLHFALLDGNDTDYSSGTDWYFTASSENARTEEDIRLIAYMPGAEEIQIEYRKNNEDEQWQYDRNEGPGLKTWFSRGESGNYTIYISGRFGGNWSEPVQVCELFIEAENAFESEPEVTVNGNGNGIIVPADADNPNRMIIAVSRIPAAEGYHVQVRRSEDDRPFFGWFTDLNWEEEEDWITITDDEIVYEIEDGAIEPGRLYELDCWIHATGYESVGVHRRFLLQDEQAAGTVTLSVEPRNDDGVFWTGDNVEISVTAPNATALKLCKNDQVNFYGADEFADGRTIGWNIDDVDTLFYAYATTDEIPDGPFDWNDLNWSMRSEVIQIHAETEGYISDDEMPSVSFDDHLTKGDWLEVTIGEGNTRQTDIRIRDEWGGEREFRRTWMPGTYRLPTVNLEPGRYQVTIDCVQDRHLWTHGPEMDLYVSEPEPENDIGFFVADKTELYPGEMFTPMVYWPGAEHIWIADEHWNPDPNDPDHWNGVWGEWYGNCGTNDADWAWWFDEPGEYELTAWALEEGQAQVMEIGRAQFTVLEPTPLAQPEIQVDNIADAFQPIYIDIPEIAHAYSYELQLHVTDMETQPVFRYNKKANDAENGKITFTVEAGLLTPNASYWIDCYVQPRDGDYAHFGSNSSKNILTTDGNGLDGNITVSVVEGEYVTFDENGILILINAPFEVKVSAETEVQPTAVAVYMGDRVEYRFFNDGDGDAMAETIGMSEYQPWPETIFARAYYEDLGGYDSWEDVPWSSLGWNAPSSPVQVTFTSNGPAEPADIEWPWATMEGQDMIIRVTLGEHANEAHANLDRITSDGWEENLVFDNNWIGWEEDPDNPGTGIIRIPTEGLATRCYRLHVDNSGIGYDNSRSTAWLWVAENPYLSESKLTLPSDLRIIEDEAFKGIDADTVILPYGVETIGARAFADSRVRLIVIPSSVTTIGEGAFSNTRLLIVYTDMWTEAVGNCVADFDAAAFCIIGE